MRADSTVPRGGSQSSHDREAALAELAAALASLEGGGPPAPFLGGHGIQSRLIEFAWSDPALEIDFRLPWGLALDEEEPRRARDAEIGAAIRLALLLQAPAAGDGGRITVAADSRGVSYAVFAPDGSLEDAGDDWEPLVRRLETGLAGTASAATVFWP